MRPISVVGMRLHETPECAFTMQRMHAHKVRGAPVRRARVATHVSDQPAAHRENGLLADEPEVAEGVDEG